MATNQTTAKWQSNSTGGLSRSQAALISSHWTEIARCLAPPGVAWDWSESLISRRVKYRWKCAGLIRRAADGDRWMTSMRLWCHVIDRAGDDVTIGQEAVGQETLDVPPGTSPETRVLATTRDTTRRGPVTLRQSTLTGGITNPRDTDSDQMRKLWRKAPTWREPTAKELAVEHPCQTRLSKWTTGGSIDNQWAVTSTVSQWPRPRGQCYDPAGGLSAGQATLAAFCRQQWHVTVPGNTGPGLLVNIVESAVVI